MITAETILHEIMREHDYEFLNKELGFPTQYGLTYAYTYEYERFPSGKFSVSDEIVVSPGGVIVKHFKISKCGMKVSWRHDNIDYEVSLFEPDSIDEILAYVKDDS